MFQLVTLYRLFIVSIFLGWSGIAVADEAFVHRKDVQEFIQSMVKKDGFKEQTLNELFAQVKIRPQVISQIRKPLEKEPWLLYQMLFVNEWRISHGVEFWEKYKDALERAEKTYGVPASIIVATIGIETRYGQKTGEHRVIDALTNIAFSDSTRTKFFRKELREFLLLTREQNLDPLKVMGSYAGAIGQPQFMPSSYRHYAVNFSGSGKIDLMNDEVDVIGSIANYYAKHGWRDQHPVAVQASVMSNRYNFMMRDRDPKLAFKVQDLSRYGIVPKVKIAHEDLKVKLIELDNRYSKEYWLGFPNFDVIKRYNQSDLYAMAVYQLSYYIKTLRHELKQG
jgi:membrane-bound lytic murein transglycosylase B